MLIIKNKSDELECSFLKEGFKSHVVVIKDDVLAAELARTGVNGIVEGAEFHAFRTMFNSFSLRVKAKKLYQELRDSLPAGNAAMQPVTNAA